MFLNQTGLERYLTWLLSTFCIQMNIFFPQNIFSKLIAENLPAQMKKDVVFLPSSLLTTEIKKHPDAAGLIPTTDLIKHEQLFVSKSFGLSFESSLCNSYIYYSPNENDLKEVILCGDVSSVEVILCKILFLEMYKLDVETKIAPDDSKIENQNLILTGDKNFTGGKHESGISFAEEIQDTFSIPFVNYVFASQEKKLISLINEHLRGVSGFIYDSIEEMKFGPELSDKTKGYIKENISSLIIDLSEQDIDGINQIIRLPFYYGLINDIVEVKYV